MLSVSASAFVTHSANAETSFDSVKKLIEQQNIEQAFLDIKTLQQGKNELSEVQILFGDLYLALEQPAKAYGYFEKVLFSSTQYDAGQCWNGRGELSAAYSIQQLADKSLPKTLILRPNW